jgi:hypothetical protein
MEIRNTKRRYGSTHAAICAVDDGQITDWSAKTGPKTGASVARIRV